MSFGPAQRCLLPGRLRGRRGRRPLNAINERLPNALSDTSEVFLSHTNLGGCYVIRLAVGNIWTTEVDVRRAWDRLRELAGTLRGNLLA